MTANDFKPNGKYWYLVEQVMQVFTKISDKVEYILPNCTIGVCVVALAKGLPMPVSSIPNANLLHTRVANGWKALPFTSGMKLKENDIIEWGCNHTAFVIGNGTNPQVVASWWTNYDGTSKGNRGMRLTSTMVDTANYLFNRYVYRYFHETSFEDEQNRGGGKTNPTYILRYEDNKVETTKDSLLKQIKKLANQIIDLC